MTHKVAKISKNLLEMKEQVQNNSASEELIKRTVRSHTIPMEVLSSVGQNLSGSPPWANHFLDLSLSGKNSLRETASLQSHLAATVLPTGYAFQFMKRSKEKEELRVQQEAENLAFKNNDIQNMTKEGNRIILEPRFGPCEMLRPGRLSFKGMNPEIEKLMIEERENKPKVEDPNEGITSKEMAERYSSLIDTMGKKFTKKRARSSRSDSENIVSKQFKKPKDD